MDSAVAQGIPVFSLTALRTVSAASQEIGVDAVVRIERSAECELGHGAVP